MDSRYLPRREFLARAGGGIGGLALATLLAGEAHAEANPLAPKKPHFAPKAKRVISIFCFGGLSHMDTFDPKPELDKNDGMSVADKKEFETGGRSAPGKLMKSPWAFKNYGKCGMPVSDLLPNIGACADDLGLIRSMRSESNRPCAPPCTTCSPALSWRADQGWVVG
ncbi:MAG: DUF1501 domain-containing protein [Armatimonas sp.]